MKKHNMMRAASALAVVTLLSTGLISGTLAKYVSEKSVDSKTVKVATWAFKVNDKNIATEDFTFDLFGDIKDSDGQREDDVKQSGDGVIAPGTSGQFSLVLKNDSEVTANYKVTFEAENAGSIPLKYAIKSADTPENSDWVDNVSALNKGEDSASPLTLAAKEGTITYTVFWKWDYGTSDTVADNTVDTTLGEAGTATAKVTAKVTAIQAD